MFRTVHGGGQLPAQEHRQLSVIYHALENTCRELEYRLDNLRAAKGTQVDIH